jgi:CheY-like chemotaxis protein
MIMTINRCIDYTKATSGLKLNPNYETIDLQETLNLPIRCVNDIQSKIDISLGVISSNICNLIITDKQWLQENILCLLSNAVKYSMNGNVSIKIELVDDKKCAKQSREWAESGDNTPKVTHMLRVLVEDTGIGISDEVMQSLFTPFKQAQRHAGGTGLGLYSLSLRMDALKGAYGVEKRRDGLQGMRFWFDIPYRPDDQSRPICCGGEEWIPLVTSRGESDSVNNLKVDPPPLTLLPVDNQKSPTPKSLSPPVFKTPLNILVVDDSLTILKMSSMLLRRQGHIVTKAENGAEAVETVEKQIATHGKPFDVVLMDLQMPVMDGLEATRRLRVNDLKITTHSAVCSRPASYQLIIGVSANSDHGTMTEALGVGMDAFLAKPFTMDSFNVTYTQLMGIGGGTAGSTPSSSGSPRRCFTPRELSSATENVRGRGAE